MEASQKEGRQREESQKHVADSSENQASPKTLHFATFEPGSTSAVHLLETVKITASPDHYLSQCLVSDDEHLLYLLSLYPVADDEAAPAVARLGTWRIGAGPTAQLREKGVPCCEVDLLICPPGRSAGSRVARQSIGSVHAILQIHAASGALLLRNACKKPIIYMRGQTDGRHLTLHGGDSCLLFHQHNHIRFGDYEFVLSFSLDTPKDRDDFRAQRDSLLLHSYGQWPSQHLDLVPSSSHTISSDVSIHRMLSRDTGRYKYSGIRLHTGEPVLLRRIHCNPGTQRQVQDELRMTAMFDTADFSGVLSMLGKAWCEHGISPPCQIESETPAEDVYYASQLAEYHFLSMPWSKLGMGLDVRLDYFHQTLKGLGELHNKGLIHGQLRPESLVLVPTQENPQEGSMNREIPPLSHDLELPPYPPMTAAISDLHWAKASLYRDDKPDSAGAWVAPEVWTSSAKAPYTNKADIWGLAMSWLPTFVQIPADVKMTRANFGKIQATVKSVLKKGHITKPFCNLVLSMLAWDPDDRPSIRDVLANEVWVDLQRRKESEQEMVRMEREKRLQDPGPNAKKVRLLSPEAEE
ncbi:putative serine threonine protein kinase [Rosellinia necatrix]|uniref:Putative serine threonine protein kinase n=1 Tax=Rosellinia necatrix TaxID=77044 RepID=A0A1W2TL54_ROSNE|nr:putative serine threonine protein kinase [Rosellinia necatrix]